uniref:Uncharacterized protein n=1 Tax=Phyllostachys edulis TaxID=38705 RepID=D3IVQ0_PHYED|nr:hypothetical protein [Phyllostachys edulis]
MTNREEMGAPGALFKAKGRIGVPSKGTPRFKALVQKVHCQRLSREPVKRCTDQSREWSEGETRRGGPRSRSCEEIQRGGPARRSYEEIQRGGPARRSYEEVLREDPKRRSCEEIQRGGLARRSCKEVQGGGGLDHKGLNTRRRSRPLRFRQTRGRSEPRRGPNTRGGGLNLEGVQTHKREVGRSERTRRPKGQGGPG